MSATTTATTSHLCCEVRKDLENEGDRFLLKDEKWHKLQLYVKASQRLPTTLQNLVTQLGVPVTDLLGAKVIVPLLNVYSSIVNNCDAFRKDYHQVVSLANDAISYTRETQACYPQIEQLYDAARYYTEATFDHDVCQQAARDLRSVLARLSDRTEDLPDKIRACIELIQKFDQGTSNDRDLISELGERVARLDSEINVRINRIKRDAEEKSRLREQFNTECEEVLPTRQSVPWFTLVPFAGWIAAPIVSGQALARAQMALNEIRRLDNELHVLTNELIYAERLKATLVQISGQLQGLATHIAGTLDTLAVMTQTWVRMATVVEKIASTLAGWRLYVNISIEMLWPAQAQRWAEIGRLAESYVSLGFAEVDD